MANFRKTRKRKSFDFYINETGCFICNSHSLTNSGHIKFKINNQWYNAHRYIYEECFGVIDSGSIFVRHKCDNPACINPEHLELGTNLDNIQDMVNRGRNASGESHGMVKLTEVQVITIRDSSLSWSKLAGIYGVSKTQIGRIKNNKSWRKE